MTLTQLMYFCEVAKTRHFTAAANNRYVAQSSLSYAISELETELSVPLFIRRTKKQVELTNYGQTFLSYVEASLKMLDDGKYKLESMKSELQGSIKIGFFFSVALTTAPTLVRRFLADHPDSQIKFDFEVNHNWMNLKEALKQGRCDMIISASRLTSGCESAYIAGQRIMLMLPNNHPLMKREMIIISDLRDEQIIAIDANSNLDLLIKEMFQSADIEPDMTYVSDWTTQQVCVSMGNGVALTTNIPVDESLLKKIPIDHPKAIIPLYLSWPDNQQLSQATVFFRDYLLELDQCSDKDRLVF